MASNRLVSRIVAAAGSAGALFLAAGVIAGCGGGGSSGGVDRPAPGFQLGAVPVVSKLDTPLGLAGSRGSGASVFVSVNLKDKEFNQSDLQVEYGYDVNGDTTIFGSDGEPTTTDEYFPCTPVPGVGSGMFGLDTASGRGADHLFVWNSTADVPGARLVTQDYEWTPQGRPILGSNGEPVFANTPAIRLRARANDNSSAPARWGQWRVTAAFSLNNNNPPKATIDSGTGLFGVSPNATGTAADEAVVLNFHLTDLDSDPMAVAIDYAQVPEAANLADPNVVAALSWFPASTLAGSADTALPSSPAGTATTFTWDSSKDAGTVNGRFILRVSPFDAKLEHGPTVLMDDGALVPVPQSFRLDNFTIFTDAGAVLSQARLGHRATTLVNDRVLITGGRTTAAGASVTTAELFFPGIGSTTYGAVAATASMGTARSFHSQTRLFDDRVLVAGGFGPGGNALNTMEVYDPVAGTWSAVPATLGTARARHAAVVLGNGDVLLAGGVDTAGNALAGAEVYDPDTNTVTAVPESLAAARHSVTGVLLPDGRVLLAGGKNTAGAGLSSAELYDRADNGGTGGFTAAAPMGAARAEHSVSVATDGRVIVTGGVGLASVETYDPLTNTWTAGPAMSSARAGHVGALTGDGRVLVAGGHNGTTVVATAQAYIPSSNSFDAPNGTMRTARRDAATAVLNNGRVLIVGGTDAAGAALASLEIYTADGGSNFGPTARIVTPLEPQSWKFGALFSYRLIDPETDPARALFQYSVSGGQWQQCTSQGGVVGDGVPDTIAGDVNDGLVSIPTTAVDSAAPIDPYFQNTPGDHLFIWDITADLPQANYDAVKVRMVPFGAGRGVAATTTSFKIARNTRVLAQFAPFTAPSHGNIRFDYHLQDIDVGAVAGQGDSARVEFEYGVDLNGDKQIVTDDGESWTFCTTAPGGEPIGTVGTYPLVTSSTFNPTVGTTGWHVFIWDSVRDLGSPNPGVVRSDVLVRLTPYDFPAGDVEETKGRQAVVSSIQGFQIDIDPNGLFLVSWRVQSGTTYAGSQINGVLLDERIIFTFSNEVNPVTVDGIVGRTTLPITVGGRQVLGTYRTNPANFREVEFYPQLNNIVNGAPQFNGTENPTILVRGATAAVNIPGYVPGTDPSVANVLRLRTPGAGGTAVEIVNLPTLGFNPAFQVTAAAGTAAFFPNGTAPTYSTSSPANGAAGQAVNQTVSVTLSGQISAESFSTANIRFRVDLDGDGIVDGNDSVIPGTVNITNSAGSPGQSVITFTPMTGFNYPIGTSVLVDFSGLRAGDGTAATGGTSGKIAFGVTGAGATSTTTFTEDFSTTTNRDAAATTALWNDAAYPGVLTGLRDGGTGADGTPTPTSSSGNLKIFSAKDSWNFTTFSIPKAETWRFTGGASNLPVSIKVTGDVNIAGVLDVSGGDGPRGSISQVCGTTSVSYGLLYTTTQTSGANALIGGTAIAGGGAGASSRHLQAGLAGTAGTGGSTSTVGGAGGQYSSQYNGGGGGAGHAQAGQAGGVYQSGYSGAGTAGSSYGSSTFASGLTAGSGGGSGSSFYTYYSYNNEAFHGSGTFATYYYYHPGGAGGGGGGAVKIACNGTFTLAGSGIIDASGGNGSEGFYFYSGGGGGGSGGGVWIVCGGNLNLGGMIDVRGGLGGEQQYYHPYAQGSPTRYGCFGGHGSSGRVRLDAPNIGTAQTKFFAGTNFNSMSGTLTGGTGALGSFPSGATINIDTITKDSNGFMNFTTMNIPSGTTVTLTGSAPAKMRFTGSVTISGTLQAIGGTGAAGLSATQTAANITAGTGSLGAGAGGLPNASNTTSHQDGLVGGGAGGGKGGVKSRGWTSGLYVYMYASSGAGGGRNLVNFTGVPLGTTPNGFPATTNTLNANGGAHCYLNWYYNAAIDGGVAGAGYTDPALLQFTGFTGGSGGGGGANCGYNYNSGSTVYFYGGSSGGGGGGAIGIETASSFSMGATGKIDVRGGAGGNYPGVYYAGAGGGGSGGNVLVRASTFSLTTGATIDTMGGIGGQAYSAPTSYHMGSNGGNGSPGGVRIEYGTAPSVLNIGGIMGYSTTNGSLYTAYYASGDRGATNWMTAAGLAPDFNTSSATTAGNVQVTVEGNHAHPITGLRDTSVTGSQNFVATPLTTMGSPDAVDGFKYWRLFFLLQPPTAAVPASPVVDSTSVSVTTK